MTTTTDLITLASKDAGILSVGQTLLSEDLSDALTTLNFMLGEWQRKRWLVYHLVDYSLVSTGATSYTVGPAGAFVISPRPERLEAAFFRQLGGAGLNIDYPLEILEARETYNNIALKSLVSFPSYIFYDSNFPTATVFPWPVPQATIYELHLTVKETLPTTLAAGATISLPMEYFSALRYNLGRRLRAQYQKPANEELNALAKGALSAIRGANMQIPRLTMPVDLVRPGIYNPFSDQIR